MRRLSIIAKPAVRFLGWSTDLVLRLLDAPRETNSQVSAEEVRVLMQEGQSSGIFHKAEPKMVERVLELDELVVEEIMTPRPRVVFLSLDDAHEQVWHKIVASSHSHFPVYHGNRDRVVGVVSVKAIYSQIAAGKNVFLGELTTEPLFVPATQTVVQLLESFAHRESISRWWPMNSAALWALLRSWMSWKPIVGDVPTQQERVQTEVAAREDGSWLLGGMVEIETLEEKMPGLRFP
jgi:putative hemolysin